MKKGEKCLVLFVAYFCYIGADQQLYENQRLIFSMTAKVSKRLAVHLKWDAIFECLTFAGNAVFFASGPVYGQVSCCERIDT